jgi:thiamine-phosphate pyrophosphorylase
VHLSAGSNPSATRALLGAQKLIGVSVHTVTEAEGIDPSAVDYVLAGPAFETASKPGYGPELGRKGLSAIAKATRVPVLAIGGINTARIADLIAEGATGVGVMGSVMRATDPEREVRALVAIMRGSPAVRSP